jgi:hypothetical protein
MNLHGRIVATLFALSLAIGCAGTEDSDDFEPTPGPDTEEDRDSDNEDDDDSEPTTPPDDDEPTPLPDCDDTLGGYTVSRGAELVDYFGPNISILLPDDDVIVMYPKEPTYEAGEHTFDVNAESDWAFEFCVDWDPEYSDCAERHVPQSGTLEVTIRNNMDGELDEVSGTVNGTFVDNSDNPSCRVRVNTSFEASVLD